MKKFRKTYSLVATSAGVLSFGQCLALDWEMMAKLLELQRAVPLGS